MNFAKEIQNIAANLENMFDNLILFAVPVNSRTDDHANQEHNQTPQLTMNLNKEPVDQSRKLNLGKVTIKLSRALNVIHVTKTINIVVTGAQ